MQAASGRKLGFLQASESDKCLEDLQKCRMSRGFAKVTNVSHFSVMAHERVMVQTLFAVVPAHQASD